MVPSDGGSHLTFAIAGVLWEAGSSEPWLRRATEWCWARLDRPDELSAYPVKFSLDFLDDVPDAARAAAAIEDLRSRIGPDGTIPVPGGTENERLTPLTLSPRPGGRSRALFTEDQIEADLDGWSRDSRTTAAGRSTGSRGRRGNPSSGAGR